MEGLHGSIRKRQLLNSQTLEGEEDMRTEIDQEWAKDQAWRMTFQNTWRPALGWVCVLGTAWNYVIAPAAIGIAEMAGHPIYVKLVQDEILMELLATTMGIGGMRMIEKLKKVASE